MGEEKKLPRLGAAAKEFNVATGTIVELLKKKGLEIEDNRNAKLTAEMYETLVKHLSGEKKVKEESQKLDMDFSYNKPGANKTEPEKVEQPVEEEPEVVQIKVNTIEKETIKVEVSKPKIIGKIDLEPKKKPAPKVKEPVPEPVVEPELVKEETAPEPVAEPEPVKEVKPEPEHIEINVENYTPKVVGKIDLEPKKPEPKPEEKLPEPVVETPEPAVETPTSAPEPTTEHAPEHVDLVVEKLKAPNIVGKIDLSHEFTLHRHREDRFAFDILTR